MMMNRSSTSRGAVLGLAFGLGVLAASAGGARSEEALRTQVYPGSIVSLPVWVADDGGFCKREGISCPAVIVASGPLGLQALSAGSLQITFASTDVIMQGAAHGAPVKLIVGHSANNIYKLTMRSDIGLKDKAYPAVMKQFLGKTVGVSARGAATEIQMRALLSGAGLDPNGVSYVAVGSPNTSYPAMVAKQIQAAMMWVPFNDICVATHVCDVAVDMMEGQGPAQLKSLNGAFETFAAQDSFIQAHKQSIDAFIRALTKADAWMKAPENFAEVRKIAKAHASLGDIPNADALLDQLVKSQVPTYSTSIDRTAVKAFATFLFDNKIIAQPFDTSNFVYAGAPQGRD